MKKVYYLQTCDTCKRILKEVDVAEFEKQEIKANPITAEQLEELHQFTNSYEALFNKRAKLYREKGLKNKQLTNRIGLPTLHFRRIHLFKTSCFYF